MTPTNRQLLELAADVLEIKYNDYDTSFGIGYCTKHGNDWWNPLDSFGWYRDPPDTLTTDEVRKLLEKLYELTQENDTLKNYINLTKD
jgi:hypothetical protein